MQLKRHDQDVSHFQNGPNTPIREREWLSDAKSQLIGKDPDAGKDWGQE